MVSPSRIDVARAGTFAIGQLTVNRLGFGAMRIVGPGVWGEPKDPEAAARCFAGRSTAA